ncbi:tyrosine-type recombinase/integrase [Nocardioides sp. NPDC057772]|uniref:tyrosine-type recombinase/integrase n=1 Tax=Nocardioides sp. NPDC057772 TaxID=3346245 RepID=UPI00366C31ED
MQDHAYYSEAYRRWLTGRALSPQTIKLYTGVLRRAWEDLGDLTRVSEDDLGKWINSYRGSTRYTYVAALMSVFDWLDIVGHRGVHPLRRVDPRERIKRPQRPRSRPRPFSPEEEELVLRSAVGQIRIWLLLALRQGLRRHEIAQIRGDDFVDNQLRVDGKGQKVAWLPVHPEIAVIAQEMPVSGWWFPSATSGTGHITPDWVGNQVGTLLKLNGLSGSIHRGRHTFGTTLLRNGVNPRVVQELMRHDNLETTMRYLEVIEDEKAKAISGLGSLPSAA